MSNYTKKILYDLSKYSLFKVDPELAHNITLNTLASAPKIALSIYGKLKLNSIDTYEIRLNNLKFRFPVGLAAGLDKNAIALDYFSNVGFGAVEVGTVTPLAQKGNEKPRMFRLKEELSLRNSMGFNNNGQQSLLKNIESFPNISNIPIGINLGKNKITKTEDAVKDYVSLFNTFKNKADYLVINVSSPNTPGLRHFEGANGLKLILEEICPLRDENSIPLFVKISPDIIDDELKSTIDLCINKKINGLIATNTSIQHNYSKGGVSGNIIKKQAATIRKKILKSIENISDFDLIGVGGIDNFDDLFDFWKDGGKFVQIYTSFIYQGPQVLFNIKNEIDRYLNYYKFKNLTELIKNIREIKKI